MRRCRLLWTNCLKCLITCTKHWDAQDISQVHFSNHSDQYLLSKLHYTGSADYKILMSELPLEVNVCTQLSYKTQLPPAIKK